jgi:hypothetical protein
LLRRVLFRVYAVVIFSGLDSGGALSALITNPPPVSCISIIRIISASILYYLRAKHFFFPHRSSPWGSIFQALSSRSLFSASQLHTLVHASVRVVHNRPRLYACITRPVLLSGNRHIFAVVLCKNIVSKFIFRLFACFWLGSLSCLLSFHLP